MGSDPKKSFLIEGGYPVGQLIGTLGGPAEAGEVGLVGAAEGDVDPGLLHHRHPRAPSSWFLPFYFLSCVHFVPPFKAPSAAPLAPRLHRQESRMYARRAGSRAGLNQRL